MPETNEFGQRIGDVVPGWTPRPYPTPTRLAGRYVVLEPLAPSHARDLQAALGGTANRDLWTYRPTEPPDDVAGMGVLVAEMLAAPGVETFVIRPGNGPAAGVTSLTRIDITTGQVEVAGVLYARALQRTPASTEVTHLLMRWAFDTLGYRRFEWKCDHFNEPSRRAALRLGFTYEGRFRAHMITKGRRRDTDWFSVTVEEWPLVRAAHERWLAPENFGDDGRQRSRLEVGPRPTEAEHMTVSDADRTRLHPRDIEGEDLPDWRMLFGHLHGRFRTGDFTTGAALVGSIAEAADAMDHHPDLDLRYPQLDVRLGSHDVGGVTQRDVRLAREISRLAAEAGCEAAPGETRVIELGLDTHDAEEIAGFWEALLGYRRPKEGPLELADPDGRGFTIWFQESEPGETPRQRWHLDVRVPPEVVESRIEAALAAGGTLVSDEAAPRFWVLSDAQGNRACLTTWQGRD